MRLILLVGKRTRPFFSPPLPCTYLRSRPRCYVVVWWLFVVRAQVSSLGERKRRERKKKLEKKEKRKEKKEKKKERVKEKRNRKRREKERKISFHESEARTRGFRVCKQSCGNNDRAKARRSRARIREVFATRQHRPVGRRVSRGSDDDRRRSPRRVLHSEFPFFFFFFTVAIVASASAAVWVSKLLESTRISDATHEGALLETLARRDTR